MGPLVRHRRRLGWLAAWWDKARPSSAARSRVPILVAVFSFAIAFYVIGQSAPEIVVNRGGLRRTWLLLALPAVGVTILFGYLAQSVPPHGEWQTVSAFALATAIIATLIVSLPADIRGAKANHRDPLRPGRDNKEQLMTLWVDRPRNPSHSWARSAPR